MDQERERHVRNGSSTCTESITAVVQGNVVNDTTSDASRQRRTIANHIGRGRGQSSSISTGPQFDTTSACERAQSHQETAPHTTSRRHSSSQRSRIPLTREAPYDHRASATTPGSDSGRGYNTACDGVIGTSNFSGDTSSEAVCHVTGDESVTAASVLSKSTIQTGLRQLNQTTPHYPNQGNATCPATNFGNDNQEPSKTNSAGDRPSPRSKPTPGRKLFKARKDPATARAPGSKFSIRAASLGAWAISNPQATGLTSHDEDITGEPSSHLTSGSRDRTRHYQQLPSASPDLATSTPASISHSEVQHQPSNLNSSYHSPNPRPSTTPSELSAIPDLRDTEPITQEQVANHWSSSPNPASRPLAAHFQRHNQPLDDWSAFAFDLSPQQSNQPTELRFQGPTSGAQVDISGFQKHQYLEPGHLTSARESPEAASRATANFSHPASRWRNQHLRSRDSWESSSTVSTLEEDSGFRPLPREAPQPALHSSVKSSSATGNTATEGSRYPGQQDSEAGGQRLFPCERPNSLPAVSEFSVEATAIVDGQSSNRAEERLSFDSSRPCAANFDFSVDSPLNTQQDKADLAGNQLPPGSTLPISAVPDFSADSTVITDQACIERVEKQTGLHDTQPSTAALSFSATSSAITGQDRNDCTSKQASSHDWMRRSVSIPCQSDQTTAPSTESDSGRLEPTAEEDQQTEQQQILSHIYQILDDRIPASRGLDMSLSFERASLEPPITTGSLGELDMQRIVNNPRLRHDINFDRELHFRPNLDGQKGKKKMQEAEIYWKALEAELFMYQHALLERNGYLAGVQKEPEGSYWARVSVECQKRLPMVFITVRDVLKTLVPEADQRRIMERLDVFLIMQEIRNGVCDLVELADWMRVVLKKHCAPMRDGVVDDMHATFCKGVSAGDHNIMVKGLRKLLNLLEAMKLDVANHQIRQTRPLFIEDTLNFHRRYNQQRIDIGKLDIDPSRAWLEIEMERMGSDGYLPRATEALTAGIFRELMSGMPSELFPQTFPHVWYLDFDRLRNFQAELRGMIHHEVCCHTLAALVDQTTTQTQIATARHRLRESLDAIIGIQAGHEENLENIAVEIVRIISDVEDREFDGMLVTLAEHILRNEFSQTSPTFTNCANELSDRLVPKLQTGVRANVRRSPLELQDALLPPVALPSMSAIPSSYGAVLNPAYHNSQFSDPDTDLVNRITHMVVLHWHVWSPLVYLKPIPQASPRSSLFESDNTTPPPAQATPITSNQSQSQPVTQAIYSAASEWLPTGLRALEAAPTPMQQPQHHQKPHSHLAPAITTPATAAPADEDADMTPAPALAVLARTTPNRAHGADEASSGSDDSKAGTATTATDENGHAVAPSPNRKRAGDNSA